MKIKLKLYKKKSLAKDLNDNHFISISTYLNAVYSIIELISKKINSINYLQKEKIHQVGTLSQALQRRMISTNHRYIALRKLFDITTITCITSKLKWLQ